MKHDGFTLIELLVTITILGLMLGAGVAQYGRFNQRQQLQQGTENFISYLKEVRKLAMTSSTPAAGVCANPGTVNVYALTQNGDSGVELSIVCDLGNHVWQGKEFSLPGDVEFVTFPSTFEFEAFSGELTVATQTIEITHPDLSVSNTSVTIENSGLIYETP